MTVADPDALAGHPQLKAPGQHATEREFTFAKKSKRVPAYCFRFPVKKNINKLSARFFDEDVGRVDALGPVPIDEQADVTAE